MSFDEKTMDQIKRHEGFRESVYLDTVGVPTGGYGHAFHVGSTLPRYVWDAIFYHDYTIARVGAEDIIRQYDLTHLEDARKAVLVNMVFNMGKAGVLKFQKTLAALQQGDYELAADRMMQSKWYGQVKSRAVELVKQMRTGVL